MPREFYSVFRALTKNSGLSLAQKLPPSPGLYKFSPCLLNFLVPEPVDPWPKFIKIAEAK
jgi:hypothetical protein